MTGSPTADKVFVQLRESADGRIESSTAIRPEEFAMPIHDWTRVPSGLFHHFHQDWSIEIARRFNRGVLPKGLSALVEQRSGNWAGRSNRVVVKHHLGRIVALIEIVSP